MGLDMYLERCDRKAWGFKNIDIDEAKESKPQLYEEIKPYLHERGKYVHWESIFEEVGYWRKANAIHKWFVDNVQDGEDDCGYYEVNREQLEQLLHICKLIKSKCKMKSGKIENGYYWNESGEKIPIIEDGEYIENPEIAQEYLPTQSGFFFGSTDYDEWYMKDIEYTIETLTKVLDETDFDTQMVVYTSSW